MKTLRARLYRALREVLVDAQTYQVANLNLQIIAEKVAEHLGPETSYSGDHDEFVNEIFEHCPESWDDDAAAESIAVNYVRELEARLDAAGISRDRFADPEVEPTAEGFVRGRMVQVWRDRSERQMVASADAHVGALATAALEALALAGYRIKRGSEEL